MVKFFRDLNVSEYSFYKNYCRDKMNLLPKKEYTSIQWQFTLLRENYPQVYDATRYFSVCTLFPTENINIITEIKSLGGPV